MKFTDIIKEKLAILPDSPGVYQFFNANGKIIYVGKAKNLKRRVSSYFNKHHDSPKTRILVSHIRDLKYIVVNSENEALLLENNLIKRNQPRYNILLKDGKTYPWLCITKEPFPRVFRTRSKQFKGADYFGPYSSVWMLDTLLDLVKELYPVRTCRLPLTEDSIYQNKFKVCLQYHIHNCLGVCEGLQTRENYLLMIDEIKEIARGNSHVITHYLLEQMQILSDQEKFEEAQNLKIKYDALLQFQSKTVITTVTDDDIDVFSYDDDEKSAYVNILRIAKGSVIQGLTVEYQKKLDEPREDILSLAIVDLRERFNSHSTDVIVPFLPDMSDENIKFIIPQRGDKKKLLDLSIKNVQQYKVDKYKQAEKLNPEQQSMKLLKQIQNTLKLEKIPLSIECFDNSNISGSDAVAACVVFKKAKPSKKDYRKYIIKTVVGPDDYASMKEVVRRRYSRMVDENSVLPDLIITDGGKGQMEVVREVVENELHLKIPIAGLAKNDKHRTNELLFGFPPKVIGLNPTDYMFKFLSSIQDEVHRFAITFHRDKRSKHQAVSELDSIKGIGEKTKINLLNAFKSVKRIHNAEFSELEKIIGKSRASIIYNYFHPNKLS